MLMLRRIDCTVTAEVSQDKALLNLKSYTQARSKFFELVELFFGDVIEMAGCFVVILGKRLSMVTVEFSENTNL